MRRAHSERQWPPRSFVLPVRARIAQGQREEAARRVEALAGRAQRGQAGPALRLRATTDTADTCLREWRASGTHSRLPTLAPRPLAHTYTNTFLLLFHFNHVH